MSFKLCIPGLAPRARSPFGASLGLEGTGS